LWSWRQGKVLETLPKVELGGNVPTKGKKLVGKKKGRIKEPLKRPGIRPGINKKGSGKWGVFRAKKEGD